MRRLWGGVVAAVLAISGVMPAGAAGDGGRVALHLPQRMLDTRETGPVTSIAVGSGVKMVWVVDDGAEGVVTLHPCASAPPPNQPTFRLDGNEGAVQYARIATAEDTCLTSTAPTHVIVDTSGTVTPTPESGQLQYIALSTPVILFDDSTSLPGQQLDLGRPIEVGTAAAAVLSIEALVADTAGWVSAGACDGPQGLAADLAYSRSRVANVAYVPLNPSARLCLLVMQPVRLRVKLLGVLADSGPNPTALPPSWRYQPSEVPAPSLRPITPVRLLDTRIGLGRSGTAKLVANDVLELDFGQHVGPLTTAVSLNVTVTQPDAAGYLTVWPCGGDRPVVSNLNFERGETVPNLVVSRLGTGRTVCLSGMSTTHVVADLNATYETDGGYQAAPITPERLLDTRTGLGAPSPGKLPGGQVIELQIGGRREIPDDAGAATVNVTVTEPDGSGYVTAYPCGSDVPMASNLNFVAGQTVPNLVTAKLSSDGRLCLFTQTTTHLVADVAAWYGVDQPAGLVDLSPRRVLDTRIGLGVTAPGKVPAFQFIRLEIAGHDDVAPDADAVVMNVTATEPERDGFVTVWPCDASMPTVSNLNYAVGDTRPNLVTVKLAADGSVCLYSLATTHLVADVSGYLTDRPVEGLALGLG